MKKRFDIIHAGIVFAGCTVLFLVLSLCLALFIPHSDNFYVFNAVTAGVELVSMLLPLLLFKLIGKYDWCGFGVRRTRFSLILLAVVLAFVLVPVVSFLQLFWLNGLESLGIPVTDHSVPVAGNTLELLFEIVCVAASAAICEELLFRGLTLHALSRKDKRMAVVLTALLFMLMHCSIESLPYTFLFGLLLGWLTITSGSIWPAMVYHFTNNAIAVVSQAIAGPSSPAASLTPMEMSATASFAFFCAGIAALLMLAYHSISKRVAKEEPVMTACGAAAYAPLAISGFLLAVTMIYLTVL